MRFDQIWCLGTGVGQHESVEKSNCSRLPKPLVSGRISVYALFDNQLSSTFFQCGNFHYSFYDRRGRWQKALTGTTPIVLHGDEVEIVCCFGRSTHPSPAPVEMHSVFLTERCFPSASVPSAVSPLQAYNQLALGRYTRSSISPCCQQFVAFPTVIPPKTRISLSKSRPMYEVGRGRTTASYDDAYSVGRLDQSLTRSGHIHISRTKMSTHT